MHSCLKKCLQLVVLSYCWTWDRAIASEVVAGSSVTPRQDCNTRKPLIRAQSKTVLTAHGSPTNGRLVVGKYLKDCKLITLHIPFKFLLDLLYTNKDSSLLSQTHGTTAVTSTSYTWKSSTVLIFFLNIGHICINSCNVHLSCFTKGI